eukprot:GEMP01011464.1.p1 GENE.GEMP01011464.1~~GEMP01011464.1.p1  ORF type:complete len:691 (+),score=138.16 GEMP01011464.1:183-2255(+)
MSSQLLMSSEFLGEEEALSDDGEVENLDLASAKDKLQALLVDLQLKKNFNDRIEEKLEALEKDLGEQRDQVELTEISLDLEKQKSEQSRKSVARDLQEQTEKQHTRIREQLADVLFQKKTGSTSIDTVLITFFPPDSQLRHNLTYRVDACTYARDMQRGATRYWDLDPDAYVLMTMAGSKVQDDMLVFNCFKQGEIAQLSLVMKDQKRTNVTESELKAIVPKSGQRTQLAWGSHGGLSSVLNMISMNNEERLAQYPGGYWLLKIPEGKPSGHVVKIRFATVFVYLLMLTLTAVTISFHRQGPDSYWLLHGTRSIFAEQEIVNGETIPSVEDIHNFQDLWKWLDVLPQRLYRQSANGVDPQYVVHNRPLGWLRVCQQRAKSVACRRKKVGAKLNSRCFELHPPTDSTKIASLETAWAAASITMNAGGRGTRRPYEYFGDDTMSSIRGTFGVYDGSGYMMDFNLSPDPAVTPPETVYANFVNDLALLKSSYWFTSETRSVIVSFTVYNLHYDMWQSVDFLFEAPQNGGEMWGFARILPFRPDINETQEEDLAAKGDYLRLALAFYLLLVMWNEVQHKIKNHKAGYLYVLSLNGFADVGVFVVVLLLNFQRRYFFNDVTEQAVKDTKREFKSWGSLATLYGEVIALEGVLFFLIMWRMLSFFRLNRQFYLYWRFLGSRTVLTTPRKRSCPYCR